MPAVYVPSDGLYNLSYFAISDFLMREINFGNLPSKQTYDENNIYYSAAKRTNDISRQNQYIVCEF